MGNIKRRIERLEKYAPAKPEELIALLLELRGCKEKYGLEDDPRWEKIEAAIRRVSSHSKE
jgi:hypothetical protein